MGSQLQAVQMLKVGGLHMVPGQLQGKHPADPSIPGKTHF
jgi:hypothetical protein